MAVGTNGTGGVVRLAVSGVLMRASQIIQTASTLLLFAAVGATPLAATRRGIARFWDDFEGETEASFFPWERDVATQFVRPGDHVLIAGCGSGRDTVAFLEYGCRVTAIDPAPAALARARQTLAARGLDTALACVSIEDWRGAEPVDVVWFSWFTYGYIPTSRARVAALANAAAQLKPGGRIVISYETGQPRNRAAVVARVVSRWVGNDWALETGDRIVRVNGSAFTFEHRFTEDEFASELRAAGLRIIGRSTSAVVAEVIASFATGFVRVDGSFRANVAAFGR